MNDPVVELSGRVSQEHPLNPDQSGLEASQAADFLESIASRWPEHDRLDVLLLRALARLSAADPVHAEEGFSSLDIAEMIGIIRNRPWSDTSDKERTSSDVRKYWQKLLSTWSHKKEGIGQQFRDCGISVIPVLEKDEGGGTGRMSRYRLDWREEAPATAAARNDTRPGPDNKENDAVRYVCEDLDDAGWLAKVFASGYRLSGWRRWLIAAVVAIPILATLLLFMAMLLGTINWSRVGTPVVLQGIASFLIALFVSWISFGPLWRVADRRITMAPWWMQDYDDSRLLEHRYPPRFSDRSIKAVRYVGTCPVCQGRLVVKSGGLEFLGRIVGRCANAPIEHVFSFDHVTRTGKPLRG